MRETQRDTVVGGIDQRVVKALAHPIRVRVLSMLNQRVASPSELAEVLREPLGNVSYHVRTLLELGCIELVSTAPRRGAVEHYYRATMRPVFSEADWAEMPTSLRRSIASAVLKDVWRDVNVAARNDGFDRPHMHLTRTPLVLDDEGWAELSRELARVHERAFEIQAESAQRLHDAGATSSQSAHLVMMLFEGAGGEEEETPEGNGKAA